MSTTLINCCRATYLTLFSLFCKNLPRMLMPRTLSPYEASICMIVRTHSARTELPGFLDDSVFVAIWARMSDISSELSEWFYPILPISSSILTCRNGSFTPPISYSGAYPDMSKLLRVLIKLCKCFLNFLTNDSSVLQISLHNVTQAIKTD